MRAPLLPLLLGLALLRHELSKAGVTLPAPVHPGLLP